MKQSYIKANCQFYAATLKHPQKKSRKRPPKHHVALRYLVNRLSKHQNHPTNLLSMSNVPKDFAASAIYDHECHEHPTRNTRDAVSVLCFDIRLRQL